MKRAKSRKPVRMKMRDIRHRSDFCEKSFIADHRRLLFYDIEGASLENAS